MRKFYHISRAGSLKHLKIGSSAIPPCPDNRVLVGVRAIGLNYADIFAIMGLYSATPKGSFIPGLEFSGVVLESRSPQWKQGDEVIGVTRFGGYDTHIVADPDYLMPLPAGWTFEEGAAWPVQTFTAFYALVNLGNLRPGQMVLIHSAAGGVGLQANRIARRLGAHTIGVVGSESKTKLLQKEGYDAWLLRDQHFAENLKAALGGRELNLVLEASGGKFFKLSYEALAPVGRIVSYGSAVFTPSSDRPNYLSLAWRFITRPRVDPLTMITANKSVMAFNLIWLYERKEMLRELVSSIAPLNLPPPLVGHQFPFSELPAALRLFRTGSTTGKVIINVN